MPSSQSAHITDKDIVTVRNTFINVVPSGYPTLRSSRSDSDISYTESSESEHSHDAASSTQRSRGAEPATAPEKSEDGQGIVGTGKGSIDAALTSSHTVWGEVEVSHSSSMSSDGRSDGQRRKLLDGVQLCDDSSGGTTSEDCRVESERPISADAVELRFSRGSVLHESGQCKPCNYFFKSSRGCNHGANCAYCHLDHTIVPKLRPGKPRRQLAKRVVETMQVAFSDEPLLLAEGMEQLSQQSEYMKAVIDHKTQDPESWNSGSSLESVDKKRIAELRKALATTSVANKISL